MFLAFSTSKCFDLFAVIFLLRLGSLGSKSVFAIEFACANFALQNQQLNYIVYTSNIFAMFMISNFFFKFTDFCVINCFFN